MSTILFDKLVFGPVYSRRLGISLGVNLLPVDSKFCNFNCIYCECGWTMNEQITNLELPERGVIKRLLKERLKELRGTANEPDAITFAGNGEPTIHPDFAAIIEDTIEVRDAYAPHTAIGVLSNASMLNKIRVREALLKVDKNIQKLDTGIEHTFQLLNQPIGSLTIKKITEYLVSFEGRLIIQTLFVRGHHKGNYIDNTTPQEIAAWLKLIQQIKPQHVMIYPIDRGTPVQGLEKVPEEELNLIAQKVRSAGIKTEVYF